MTGPEALKELMDGKRVRKHYWTNGCWISAQHEPDCGFWFIKGHGSPTFIRDVQEDKDWILSDLMEDGWIGELSEDIFKK